MLSEYSTSKEGGSVGYEMMTDSFLNLAILMESLTKSLISRMP